MHVGPRGGAVEQARRANVRASRLTAPPAASAPPTKRRSTSTWLPTGLHSRRSSTARLLSGHADELRERARLQLLERVTSLRHNLNDSRRNAVRVHLVSGTQRTKGFSPRVFILARRISHFALGLCEMYFALRTRWPLRDPAVWRPVGALMRLGGPRRIATRAVIRRSPSWIPPQSAKSSGGGRLGPMLLPGRQARESPGTRGAWLSRRRPCNVLPRRRLQLQLWRRSMRTTLKECSTPTPRG